MVRKVLWCAWCRRPLCEDFLSDTLMTYDGNKRCRKSPDGRHRLER